jgi:NAD(P)-dependent dehydrogenase (short-subunit alcohol dehydrogenase family)
MAVALVTGATRGFGHAVAKALVEAGWTVIATGRDPGRLDRVRALAPGRVVAVEGEITDPEHHRALAAAVDRSGGLDLLIHNASELGPSPLPPVAELDPAQFRRILEVNVVAVLAITQQLLPYLLTAAQPTVVALSSDAAVEGYEGWSGYGASKAALDQLMRVLAVEQPTLRTYAFDPGDMRTDMHQRAFPGEDISDRPEPGTVVPALLELLRRRPESGRYCASALLAEVHA